MATWSARAFFHHDPALRVRERGFLCRLLGQANVVCLQESHGSDSDIRDSLNHGCKYFSFLPSFCTNSDSGGVITIVRSSLLLGSTVSSSPLVPGRVLRTCVTKGQCKWVIYNIHNHGIPDLGLDSVIHRFIP